MSKSRWRRQWPLTSQPKHMRTEFSACIQFYTFVFTCIYLCMCGMYICTIYQNGLGHSAKSVNSRTYRKPSFSLVSMLLPCSLEISGLYQNLVVSWTNLTFSLLSGLPSAIVTKRTSVVMKQSGGEVTVRFTEASHLNNVCPYQAY